MIKQRRTRPGWGVWALGIAEAVSLRGDCTRRQVGAVLLDGNHRVIGCGYNGGPAGGPSCLAGDCPRGRHHLVPQRHDPLGLAMCVCGYTWPCPEAVEPGSSYDNLGSGECIAVHAEINALLDVSDRGRLVGATMYVTEEPCGGCRKILANTAISAVVWPGGRIG